LSSASFLNNFFWSFLKLFLNTLITSNLGFDIFHQLQEFSVVFYIYRNCIIMGCSNFRNFLVQTYLFWELFNKSSLTIFIVFWHFGRLLVPSLWSHKDWFRIFSIIKIVIRLYFYWFWFCEKTQRR
jgi:hypothetical protein